MTDSTSKARRQLLTTLDRRLETPMLVLSFVWLVLMVFEFTAGLSSFLQSLSDVIWAAFIVDFAVKLLIAPDKSDYFRNNWVTALALILPALRLFRILRLARLARTAQGLRGLRLARILTSLNRGIRALGKSLGRRGFGYVLLLTLLVTLVGAAGMYAFEKDQGELSDYGTAVWWTAMMLTTMGSDYFPKSSEGRILCLLLATYGFAVFGYVTATVATFFVSEDNKEKNEPLPTTQTLLLQMNQKLSELQKEVSELKIQQRSISQSSLQDKPMQD